MTTVTVGEMFTFKTTKGRGRPFVGEVVRKAGALTYMKMKDGAVVAVQSKMILKPYNFKPYNTKKRQAEVAA
jgi:hypothetical protein